MLIAKAKQKQFYVMSIQEAVRIWQRMRALGKGDLGEGLVLVDETTGEIVAHVLPNSEVRWNWPAVIV